VPGRWGLCELLSASRHANPTPGHGALRGARVVLGHLGRALASTALAQIAAAAAQLAGHSLERVMRAALAGYAAQKIVRVCTHATIPHDLSHLPAPAAGKRTRIGLGEDG